jgi:hypothetical protein
MPRSNPFAALERKQPICDEYILAAINHANDQFNEQGHYSTLVISGFESRDEALDYKRGLYRSLYHVNKVRPKDMAVSMFYTIVKRTDGKLDLSYTVVNKVHARAFQVNVRGSDRSLWSYDPRAPKKVAD